MARRPCIVHGCPEYVTGRQPRCETHQREWKRGRWDAGFTGSRGSRPGWRSLRKRVWREQGGKCGRCPARPERFWLHHINENAKDDRRENLIGLCEDCHKAAHAR